MTQKQLQENLLNKFLSDYYLNEITELILLKEKLTAQDKVREELKYNFYTLIRNFYYTNKLEIGEMENFECIDKEIFEFVLSGLFGYTDERPSWRFKSW